MEYFLHRPSMPMKSAWMPESVWKRANGCPVCCPGHAHATVQSKLQIQNDPQGHTGPVLPLPLPRTGQWGEGHATASEDSRAACPGAGRALGPHIPICQAGPVPTRKGCHKVEEPRVKAQLTHEVSEKKQGFPSSVSPLLNPIQTWPALPRPFPGPQQYPQQAHSDSRPGAQTWAELPLNQAQNGNEHSQALDMDHHTQKTSLLLFSLLSLVSASQPSARHRHQRGNLSPSI